MELIVDLGIVFIAAAIFGVLIKALRLPLIIAYILAGIILGNSFLGIITDKEIIENLSTLGIALMLFMVGLELHWNKIKEFSKTVLIVGLGQIVISGTLGYGLALAFGLSSIPALYVALCLTFSSTVVAVKLLGDKRDLNSLYGKIAIGVMLIQDIVAVLALIFLYGVIDVNIQGVAIASLIALLKGGLLLGVVLFFRYTFLPAVFRDMATSTELLLIASLGWAFVMALIAHLLGFGLEMGAFLAGVAVATLPYSFEISAQIKSIRDFFITLFFATLGLNVVLDVANWNIAQIVILILFVVIGQALIIMTIMGLLGFRRRTSFQVAVTLAQISEFSLIIIALGVIRGDISQLLASQLTIMGIITIIISTILIENLDQIYHHLARYLKIFEKSSAPFRDDKIKVPVELKDHIIIFGADHIGKQVLDALKRRHHNMLVVDFNPTIIKRLHEKGIPAIYGDMGDPEFINALGLERASMIISTIHDFHDNLNLVKRINKVNKNSIIYVMANTPEQGIELYRAGAERVILPASLVSDLYSELIKGFDKKRRFNIQAHIKDLKLQQKKYFS
jgi:Kef-type K+ transport system membrane component KefB